MTLSTVNLIGAIGGAAAGVVGTIIAASARRLGAKGTWRAGALVWLVVFVFMVILQYLHAKVIGFKPVMLVAPIVFLITFLWWLIKRKLIEDVLGIVLSALDQRMKT